MPPDLACVPEIRKIVKSCSTKSETTVEYHFSRRNDPRVALHVQSLPAPRQSADKYISRMDHRCGANLRRWPDRSLRPGVPNSEHRGTANRPGNPLKAHDSAVGCSGGRQDPSRCSRERQTAIEPLWEKSVDAKLGIVDASLDQGERTELVRVLEPSVFRFIDQRWTLCEAVRRYPNLQGRARGGLVTSLRSLQKKHQRVEG